LSTSVNGSNRRILKGIRGYLLVSLFVLIFHLVYHQFSHGVSSDWMTWAWTIPLTGGIVSCLVRRSGRPESRLAFNAWNSGLAALTLGAILRGVMEIAGTESDLIMIFWILGTLCLIAAPVLHYFALPDEQSVKKSPF